MPKTPIDQQIVNFYRTLFSVLGVFLLIAVLFFVYTDQGNAGYSIRQSIQLNQTTQTNGAPLISTNLPGEFSVLTTKTYPIRMVVSGLSANQRVVNASLFVDGKKIPGTFEQMDSGPLSSNKSFFYSGLSFPEVFSGLKEGNHEITLTVWLKEGQTLKKEYILNIQKNEWKIK